MSKFGGILFEHLGQSVLDYISDRINNHTHDSSEIADIVTIEQFTEALDTKSDSTHTHNKASSIIDGLMSKEDKAKLDAIQDSAKNTVIINNLVTGGVTSALSAEQGKVLKGMVDSKSDNTHTHSNASTLAHGLMSKEDKIKLDGIQANAKNTIIINDLTSGGINNALSAEQGKALKSLVDSKSSNSHTHNNATTLAHGFMSKEDKAKLDGIQANAKNTVIVDNLTSTSTSSALSANQGKILKGLVDGKADSSHTHSNATTSTNGFMSSTDKAKLDGIQANAKNTIIVNNLTSGGTNSALSAEQGKVLKGLIDNHTYNNASTTANGLMSKEDKAKLDGIQAGATNTVIVDNLTSTSTTSALSANQGKILKGLVDGKADSNHRHKMATDFDDGLMSSSDKTKLNSIEKGATKTTIINDLTSGGTGKALSAAQGVYLKELVDGKASSNHTHSNYYTKSEADNKINDIVSESENNLKSTMKGIVIFDSSNTYGLVNSYSGTSAQTITTKVVKINSTGDYNMGFQVLDKNSFILGDTMLKLRLSTSAASGVICLKVYSVTYSSNYIYNEILSKTLKIPSHSNFIDIYERFTLTKPAGSDFRGVAIKLYHENRSESYTLLVDNIALFPALPMPAVFV